MLFKRNNKAEANNSTEEVKETVVEKNDNIEQTEVVTDEELLASKKKNDSYMFDQEADVLLGKDEKKPTKQAKKVEPKVESKPEAKVEPFIEEIAPIEEKKVENTEETSQPKERMMDEARYEIDELQSRYDMLEEKNKNLARILKNLSVELKDAREESERQFEVIGKLASEKQALEQENKELVVKANKLEYDVEIKDEQLSSFKSLGDEAGDIQSKIFNFKETAKTISLELNDKKAKLKESLTRVKDLEAQIRDLEAELNKVKDEKEDLAIVVVQQQKRLENKASDEINAKDLENTKIDYKGLDKQLKKEVDDLSDQIRSKDRLIVRQVSQIGKLNETIKDLDNDTLSYQDKIDDLTTKNNAYLIELNSLKNFIKKSSNGTLLGKVMNNELDLKLKNYIPVSKEKMVEDEEISDLLEKIDETIESVSVENKTPKQYKFEIFEGIQAAINDFINDVVQKEATAYDYIVAMNDFEYEKEKLANEYQKKIDALNKSLREKERENNRLKIDLFNVTSATEDNRTIAEYKDDNKRLNKQVEFLKAENEILANESTDEAIKHLVEAFETERDSNRETEKLLKGEIATIREKLTQATSDLEKLNGEYIISQFEHELSKIDSFIEKVESGEIQVKSNLFDAYYTEAYEKFSKQMLIYNDEINKRDELLKALLDDKSEEQGRMVEKEINGDLIDDLELKERVKHNEELIEAIEDIFNNKIVKLELEPKRILDKRILSEFRETIKDMYVAMINNINNSAKAYSKELTETSAVKAMELFNNDVNKMAKYYSEAVDEAYLEYQTNTNEFAKVISNAKLAILCNEFATLVKFKEEKSREKFNGIYHENGEYADSINNNFSGTLEDIKFVKEELNKRIAEINATFDREMIKLNNDIEEAKQQIDSINEQIKNSNDENDISSLKINLDTKTKVLSYLDNEKRAEIVGNLNKQVQDVKLQLEAIDKTEKKSKEDYIERSSNEATFNKDMNALSLDINNAYGVKEINLFLEGINNIELGYFEAMNKNDNDFEAKVNMIHDQMDEINKKAIYYRNLVLLKNDYVKTANVMKTDYEQIREYERIQSEVNYINKQINFYNNEITKAKERIAGNIDVTQSKDSIVMFQAKLLNFNAQLEAKNVELDEAKSYYIVSQYVNVLEKINRIDEIIKEKGKEIE